MAVNSVGHAWSILKGRAMGNPKKAESFLGSMPPAQLREQNRQESSLRIKARKRHNKPGQLNKPGQRRA